MSGGNVEELIAALDLRPHPEGGFFAETFRSPHEAGARSLSTAIYFLLTAENPSRMHRVTSDEMWQFYRGDPLEMLQIHPDGSSAVIAIGPDVAAGQRPQVLVPAGVWHGVRVAAGGRYALTGATVTPGFDFDDFTLGDRAALQALCPSRAAAIEDLTD